MVLASFRTSQRRRRTPTAGVVPAVVAMVVLAMLALAGCSGDEPPAQPETPATVDPTPLADYDTTALTLVRDEFCARIDPLAVERALGAGSTTADDWAPGARLPGSKDISNEFGCSWTSGSASIGAWVFAPPVAVSRAGDFADELVGKKCKELPAVADLGRPSVAQECGDTTGVHGLVGDAWVGCELSTPAAGRDERSDRVGEWCVAVLEALRTS